MNTKWTINKQNLGKTVYWNPWVGCSKVSEACLNCSVDTAKPFIFKGYDFVMKKPLVDGTIILTTLSSDFFLEDADLYRNGAWDFIKKHPNLIFLIITKRVERIKDCLPCDWADGYNNVILSVTVENNFRASERLPIFRSIPAKHKWVSVAPILESIDICDYLAEQWIEHVEVLGEKFFRKSEINLIRACRYEWIKNLSDQCRKYNIRFSFLAGGWKFIYNNSIYQDNYACYHSRIADDLNLDIIKPIVFELDGITITI